MMSELLFVLSDHQTPFALCRDLSMLDFFVIEIHTDWLTELNPRF